MRGLTNQRGEFLITTLPVADLGVTPTAQPLVFPHYADGGGWTTEFMFVNPTDSTMSGKIRFFGDVAVASLPDSISSTSAFRIYDYNIPPRSSRRLVTGGQGSQSVSSWVQVTPSAGSVSPSGLAVFSFRQGGNTLAEAGVPVVSGGTAFRIYAETEGNFDGGQHGAIQTGVAIANLASTPATVRLELAALDGTPSTVTGTLVIQGNSQTAKFLNQFQGLESLPPGFRGILRIVSTGSTPVSVLGLRARYNERGDLLVATLPPVNESVPSAASELIFPHLADAGGYTTQVILMSSSGTQASSGTIRFVAPTGLDLSLPLVRLAAGRLLESGRQVIPAATGGTITLPSGVNVKVPGGLLKSDQEVTVSVFTEMPRQTPGGLFSSIGNSVSLTFAKGAINQALSSNLTVDGLAQSLGNVEVNLGTSSLPADPGSYVPIAEILPPGSANTGGVYVGLPSSSPGVAVIPGSTLAIFAAGADSVPVTVNVGDVTYNPLLQRYPSDYGPRVLEPITNRWLNMVNPTTPIRRGVKTCVLVHGMNSNVENAFSEGSNCGGNIGTANGCEQVLGFNYDWTKGIGESGLALASFINGLKRDYGINDVVLEAHSEGTAVSLAAGGQTAPGLISHFVSLGGPLMGTPAASGGVQVLMTLLAHGLTGCPTCGPLKYPDASLRRILETVAPFLLDLTTESATTGHLFEARTAFVRNNPNVPTTVVAGTRGVMLDFTDLYGSGLQLNALESAVNLWLFGLEKQDTLISLSSALGMGSGLKTTGREFVHNLRHTELECSEDVIAEVGRSVKLAAAPVVPPAVGPPVLAVSPPTLPFTAFEGGLASPTSQSFTIENTGATQSTLTYTASASAAWIRISGPLGELKGGQSASMDVSVVTAGLPVGTSSGLITVSAPGLSSKTIAVTLTIRPRDTIAATLSVTPLTMAFSVTEGAAAPAAQTMEVRNTGPVGSILAFTVTSSSPSWLSATGSTAALAANGASTFTVNVNPTGLLAGITTATINVVENVTNVTSKVTVTLTVLGREALLSVTPIDLPFAATAGSAAPAGKPVTVRNAGVAGSTLTFRVESSASWLSATGSTSPLAANATSTFNIAANHAGLAAGTYTGKVTFTNTATNASQAVAVTLTVSPAPATGSGLTGTWTGTWTRRPSGFCDTFTNNITWTLTQTGNLVSGSFVHVVAVASDNDFCPNPVGTRTTGLLVGGSVSATTFEIFTEGGTRFVGTISGTTITGTTPFSGIGTGSFTVTKR